MARFSYRTAQESDAVGVSELAKLALLPETLPGWAPEAVSSLLAKSSPAHVTEKIRGAAFAHIALTDERIVGFILCNSLRFLNLLVVEPAFQCQGIGSSLLRAMLKHHLDTASDVSIVEVNATEHSSPFYRRLGFYPLSEFIVFDGCRFARLGYWRKNPSLPVSEC